ncbi:hypothetical protein Nepgr_015830 [Nepenthes gracilis]|uniref:Uncharacterized protein n=1 Tax=Nepenthes gracilis TaxID=150966 RepID=A0AAD3SNN2_NEPGR|nr:hypothetical protein Nepgr_015830 [Nepenthes gracilis]
MNTFDLCWLCSEFFWEGSLQLPGVNSGVRIGFSLVVVGANGFNLALYCSNAGDASLIRPGFHGGVSMDGGSIFSCYALYAAESLPMEVLRDYEANCIDFVMPWSLASFVLIFVMLSPAEGGSALPWNCVGYVQSPKDSGNGNTTPTSHALRKKREKALRKKKRLQQQQEACWEDAHRYAHIVVSDHRWASSKDGDLGQTAALPGP